MESSPKRNNGGALKSTATASAPHFRTIAELRLHLCTDPRILLFDERSLHVGWACSPPYPRKNRLWHRGLRLNLRAAMFRFSLTACLNRPARSKRAVRAALQHRISSAAPSSCDHRWSGAVLWRFKRGTERKGRVRACVRACGFEHNHVGSLQIKEEDFFRTMWIWVGKVKRNEWLTQPYLIASCYSLYPSLRKILR